MVVPTRRTALWVVPVADLAVGLAATGVPLASASSSTSPKVSVVEGKTKTSAEAYAAATSPIEWPITASGCTS